MQRFLVKRFLRSNRVGFWAAFSIFLISAPRLGGEVGLRLSPCRSPMADFVRPPSPPAISVGDSLFNLPVQFPRSSQYRMAIDSSGQDVTASHTLNDIQILYPNKISFSEYLKRRSRLELQNQWQLYTTQNYLERAGGTSGGRGIVIETPEIKSVAFKRVFGGGSIGLKVTGEITIDGNMRNERKTQVKTALNRAPNTNFQMKQTQRFKVEGNIGENVTVFVDQDSERPFEFDNALKLNYSSDEDGIVQSIEAGNVSLSLPGTRFVTFSAQSSGLFGIKSKFKVGGLDITAIASMEKGKKNTKTLEGGKVEEKTQIWDYQYRRNIRFFIHKYYRDNYKNLMLKNRTPAYKRDNYVSNIEVFKSDNNYQNKAGDIIEAWAAVDPERGSLETFNEDAGDYKGFFLRLAPVTDYNVNKEMGFIELNMPLSDGEVLAVAFRDSSGSFQVGDVEYDSTRINIFKLIKPRNARPKDLTWDLEWKNIYSLGTRNIDKDNFELKIYFKPPSGDPQETIALESGDKKGSLEIFGLDQTNKDGTGNSDNIIDQSDYIIDYANGYLTFPDLTPFDPEGWGEGNETFVSQLPEDKRTPEIYDEINDTTIRLASKFFIEINSASRSPVLQLGINVIPESEEVTLNGTKLVPVTDYMIDYFSGQLTLLNPGATDPNAKLQVNYESQQMFSIDKKTLLGTRAEYTLWESGSSRSFIGGTLLYLNQKTLDQRVRVGQQAPMRNIVWDVNTSLEYQPGFIDKGLEKLSYLNAQGASRIKFEGEIAQVIPNPNTLNNDATGDHDGVAYLDDFEGAKRDISLGVIYSGWGPSSIPSVSSSKDTIDTYLENKGALYWYNPYGQVFIQDIWPDREVTTAYGGTDRVNVLDMVFKPNPAPKTKDGNTRKSWAGIMTGLSAGYANQEDSKFLEIWVWGDQGRLHVDLGSISEDVIPNRDFDSEDKVVGFFRNGILDDDEDTGLDGVFGDDPPNLFFPDQMATITNGRATPYDFWDNNKNGTKEPEEPWSYDNWQYNPQNGDYRRINGYEGNRNGSVAIYPNSEDLNGNSATDFINEYFEYSFSLDKNHPDKQYIAGTGGPEGETVKWTLYRIPLNDTTRVVGEPDWTRIRYARIWIDDVDIDALPADPEDGLKYAFISIAEINLVGNEWKFKGVANGDTTLFDKKAEEKFSIEVINTHENADIYDPPKGVEGVVDPIQKIRQREQSLVLKFADLLPGETGFAQKTLYQIESLLDYKRLKMFVHGGGSDHSLDLIEGETIEFFLQLGSGNTTDNYYEIRMPVYDAWDSRNNIEIEFEDFSRLKLLLQASGKDTISERQNGHLLKISKQPSLSNIKWMIVGVQNKTERIISDEIWLDELRLSGVRKEKGMAMRARGDVNIADLFTLNGEYERRDADFHTVNEQRGGGSNSESKSLNGSVNIHKFLPAALGLSLPVSVTYSQSNSTPKWLPGSDILVNRNTVRDDSLWEAIQSFQERKGFSVSLSKRTKSRNFLIRYLADPVKTSFSYSYNHSSNSQQKYNNNVGLNGSLGYSLSFSNPNYLLPLKWLGQKGFFRKLSEAKLYYLPSNLSVDFRGSTTDRNVETRDGLDSNEYTATFNQTFSTAIKPLSFLDFDYNRSYSSDMRAAGWEEIFSSLEPGVPLNLSQSAKSGFTPKLLSWFSPSVRVSSNYRWDDNPAVSAQSGTGTNIALNRSLTISGSLDPGKFVGMFKKKSGGSRVTTSRTSTVQRPRQKVPEKEEEKKEEPKEKRPFPLLKVFSFAGGLLSKIDPISVNYGINDNDNRRAIMDIPVWQYQFGLSKNPYVRINPDFSSNAITTGNDARFSLGSGLKITQSLGIEFKYEFSTTETRGSQVMGTVNQSSYPGKTSASPFPSWSVSWRGLEKIKFINSWIKQASITHSFSGRTQTTWNEIKSKTTQITYSKDFRPLLSLNLTLKNGMTVSAQYQSTVSRTERTAAGAQNQRQTTNSFTMNSKYSKKGGIKLPFLKGKKLENNMDFQMAIGYNMNKSEQNKKKAAYQVMSNTSNWSIKPQLTYTFTTTVRGGSYIELGERKDLTQGSTKITAFGINASISLSGR